MQRLLLSLSAVVLVATACSSSTQPAGSNTTPGATDTGAPSAGATTDPGVGSPGPGSTSPGGTNTQPAGNGNTAPPATAPPTVPPSAGVYRYAQTGETRFGLFSFSPDEEGTLQIDAASGPGGARRQRQLRTYSDTHSQESFFVYRSDRVVLSESTTYLAGQQQTCDAPLVVVELPLTIGASWSDDASCDGLELSLEASVDRVARRNVDGVSVRTFVVKYVVKVRGDDVRQTTRSTVWLSPAYRLIVRAVESTTGTISGSEFSDERTEDLLSLSPT